MKRPDLIIRNKTPKMREISRRNGLANKGRRLSDKAKEHMRLAQLGRKHPSETILKMRIKARKGSSNNLWKGGQPKCIDCKEPRTNWHKEVLRCRKCWLKFHQENRPNRYKEILFYNRQRKALKHASGFYTFQEWKNLKKKYDYMCLCCKKVEPEIKLTQDHIKPLSRGGSNLIDNIQPLCAGCNGRKYTKTIDYRVSKDFLIN